MSALLVLKRAFLDPASSMAAARRHKEAGPMLAKLSDDQIKALSTLAADGELLDHAREALKPAPVAGAPSAKVLQPYLSRLDPEQVQLLKEQHLEAGCT